MNKKKRQIKVGDLVKRCDYAPNWKSGLIGIVSEIRPTLGWDQEKEKLQEELNRDQYTCIVIDKKTGKTYDVRAKWLEVISKGE